MRKHVALTGFMAAGKSTIGKKLARKLGVAFYDIDDLIVNRYGPISDIFYTQGEQQFRVYERETIQQVLDERDPGVIALGGGAVMNDDTLKLLKKRTYRVFIKVPPEQVFSRLRKSRRVRPLLGATPSLSKIREIYEARMPRYAHADYVVEAGDMPTAKIVDDIAQWLHKKKIAL
ncbi:MAG TPA: shikimate kinase [Candidatus Baltobacteraceae bacterium]|jgi:shikimate kinase/3-dehydroquinate synthase|nr:shikimate kinase [Candidatus Baltobacteraceae bacterium]